MKIHLRKNKRLLTAVLTVILLIGLTVAFAITASAEMVNVYTTSSPELEMANIGSNKSQWIPSGAFVSNMNGSAGDGKYQFHTNSWAFWESYDSLDFAYQKTAFNTGRGSVMTIETQITSWDGSGSGSAGIHVRNTLDPESVGVFLCVRPGTIYLMYRKTTAASVNQGIELSVKDNYPISFRLELNKTKNNVTGYYKTAGSTTWTTIGSVPYVASNYVYAGVAAHSVSKTTYNVCAFDGLSIKLDAPEGYVAEEGEGETEIPEASEPEIVLPEDLPVTGNTLLRETFTDGNLFPNDEKEITAANPRWTIRGDGEPNVEVNSTQTNRYLLLNPADNALMMTAGDMKWTDYSVSAEIYYTSGDFSPSESNTFHLIFRHKSVVIGGSSDYAVTLVNKFTPDHRLTGQYLQLNYRGSSKTFSPQYTTLKEVCVAQGTMLERDVTHTIRVDALDNTIAVYLDGECLITWDDTDRQQKKYNDVLNETNYPNLTGCIGFYADSTYMRVDNIVVQELSDPIGGDYDNEIGGGFDMPIPDYIKDKYERD